jgi:hypothetical protein
MSNDEKKEEIPGPPCRATESTGAATLVPISGDPIQWIPDATLTTRTENGDRLYR